MRKEIILGKSAPNRLSTDDYGIPQAIHRWARSRKFLVD